MKFLFPINDENGEFLLSKFSQFCDKIDAGGIINDIEQAVAAKIQTEYAEWTI